MGLLPNVGFLRDSRKSRKDIVPYKMSDEGLLILAKVLYHIRLSDTSLCTHPDWRLFGTTQSILMERLQLFDQSEGLILRRVSSVVAINWNADSVESLIGLLAKDSGRNVSLWQTSHPSMGKHGPGRN